MTDSTEAKSGVLDHAIKIVTLTGAVFVIIGGLYATVVGLTGGLKPQSQIDFDSLKNSFAAMQMEQTRELTALQSGYKAQFDNVQMGYNAIISRLDSMPRGSDYIAQDAHLGRLDDRINKLEVEGSALSARVLTLTNGTNAPIRIPR